jgi:hypothetical protein
LSRWPGESADGPAENDASRDAPQSARATRALLLRKPNSQNMPESRDSGMFCEFSLPVPALLKAAISI